MDSDGDDSSNAGIYNINISNMYILFIEVLFLPKCCFYLNVILITDVDAPRFEDCDCSYRDEFTRDGLNHDRISEHKHDPDWLLALLFTHKIIRQEYKCPTCGKG